MCGIDEVDMENLYREIKFSLRKKIEYNIITRLSFRNPETIAKRELEGRINFLKLNFTDSYLRKALTILDELNEN